MEDVNIFMVYSEGTNWEEEGQMPKVAGQTKSKKRAKIEAMSQSKD